MARALRVVAALVLAAAGLYVLYERVEAPQTQIFGPTLVSGRGHVVALTFDDGPNPFVTPGVLDALEREHVAATFFVVGRAARAHPALLGRMATDGDEIENHSDDHAHLNVLFTDAAIGREIEGASSAIVAATGKTPRFLRPPFGARSRAAIDAARTRGYTIVMWSAMLGDEPSTQTSAATTVAQLLPDIHDGAIIVLHDGDQGRDTHAGRTYEAQATSALIHALKARGYRFLTVAELART
jgi:peptidoglycan/xylan/chitin deacetylase (PgdA/CDA1 family)